MPWKPRWTAPVYTSESHAGRGIGRGRTSLAKTLSKRGLDDVSDLLRDLNEARKSVAYGDIGLPELDAEDVASRIEAYMESVSALIEQGRAQ